MNPSEKSQWFAQWQSASTALARVHANELRNLTDEQALRAADALLEIGGTTSLPDARRCHSGLVEQQRFFHSRRGR